jgi:hypothetical protein
VDQGLEPVFSSFGQHADSACGSRATEGHRLPIDFSLPNARAHGRGGNFSVSGSDTANRRAVGPAESRRGVARFLISTMSIE